MAAFTTGLILSDILFSRSYRVIPHLFLGGITTALFFALCQNGYEMVNWAILAVIPVYMFLSWAVSQMKYSINEPREEQEEEKIEGQKEDCQVCNQAPRRCGCLRNERDREDNNSRYLENKKPLDCPAKPLRIDTTCGISRYT